MPNLSDLVGGGGGFELIDSQTFTTSGTWTKPGGVKDNDIVVAHIVAGGGGGHGNRTSSPYDYFGGNGGEGIVYRALAGNLAASEIVVIGSGGAGGDSGTSNGADGGHSSFAGVSARGGGGGDTNSGTSSETSSIPEFAGGLRSSSTLYSPRDAKFGGGAGGWGYNSLPDNEYPGGVSLYAGNGGDGHINDNPEVQAANGEVPGGGGGGGGRSGDYGGDGARGEVRVFVVRGQVDVEALLS